MKSTTFALGSLLATIAIAQPHRHQQFHQKRADAAPVVITTEWVEVYETEYVTSTIWVSEGEIPATSPPASTVIPTAVPAQFFEPKSPAVAAVPTPSTSSSVYVAPAPQSTSAPAPVVEAAAPVAAKVEAAKVETSAPVVVAPVVEAAPTTAPVVAPVVSSVVAPVTSQAAAPVDTSASGSSTGLCGSKSELCGGDLTFYDPVMESWGACGWHNDGLTEKVVALPVGLMGAQSNGNPYCGKYITILHKGKSTVAKVVDKCMGCKGRDIDISRFAFDDLDDQGVGRTTATWYFNE